MDAVYLDLDGTLLSFARPYPRLPASAFESALGESHDDWVETYLGVVGGHLDRCVRGPCQRAFADVADEFDIGADPSSLAEALLEAEAREARPPADAEAVLEDLSSTYRLGVLTNGPTEWQRTKLRRSGLADHVESVVTSYDAGAPKPDPAPYRLAEERLPADRYLMVGDSPSDVEGAEAAGWAAHRFEGDSFEGLPAVVREAFEE